MKAQQWILGSALILGIGGSIFKIMHWYGADILLVLAFTLLFVNTLFYVFQENRKSGASEFTNLMSVVALCMGIAGAVFRLLHWPFADFILLFGHGLLFVFITWITLFQPRPKLAPLFTGTALVFFFLTVFFLSHYPLQKLNTSQHTASKQSSTSLLSNFQMAQP
jgi:hypothetical protein